MAMSNSGKWILGIGLAFVGFALLMVAFAFFSFSALLSSAGSDTAEEVSGSGTERVAVVEINEPITESDEIIRQLKKFRDRASVKAIVLRLNSPGGAVAPSQEIFDEVRRTRELGKPVVASMSSVAASGAYYIACGASCIVANPGTITGSIGVISQFMNYKGLMDKVGVTSTTIKSGRFKDAGNPARAMTPEEVAQMQTLINDVYEQFIEDVAAGRKLPVDSVRAMADGRVYTGRQAYALGLVDTLGTFENAVRIAGTLGKVEGTPRVVRERRRETIFERIMGARAGRKLESLTSGVSTQAPLEYALPFGR